MLSREALNNLSLFSRYFKPEEVKYLVEHQIPNKFYKMMWIHTVEKGRISKLDFYSVCAEYCFASARFQAATRDVRLHFIQNTVGKKALDYGGGSGDLSIMLAKRGFEVYYVDVDGVTSDFADFRFKKLGLPIKYMPFFGNFVFHFEQLPIFDDIFCIDVIEHLDQQEQLGLLRCFNQHLTFGGRLFLTGPKTGGVFVFNEKAGVRDHPEHRGIKFDIAEYLCKQGFNRLGKGIWEKKKI